MLMCAVVIFMYDNNDKDSSELYIVPDAITAVDFKR